MKSVCEALNVVTLSRTFVRQFRRTSVSPDMRAFANIFLALQEGRHLADYDPLVDFTAAEAERFIRDAEAAMAAFDRAEPEEWDDVLALMLTSPGG